MSWLLIFALGCLGTLVADYLFPSFRRFVESVLSWLFHVFNSDRFDLTGKWRQKFREPTTEDLTKWEEIEELVEIKHFGNRVAGTGETQDNHRRFHYDCKVQQNLVFGAYVKQGARGNITGNGMIQLIVSPDRLRMQGQATWFDHDTNRIESSECTWEKI
jgi:hypothetical protein